jgi:transposase
MEEKQLLETAEIDENDWEQTPVSVRNLVVKLFDKIEQLEKHLKELQETNEKISEKVNQNSQNSNNPPTSEPLNVEIPKKKKKLGGKKRGGQIGHKGHSRFLYSEEKCKEIIEHHPDSCKCCGEKLRGIDRAIASYLLQKIQTKREKYSVKKKQSSILQTFII